MISALIVLCKIPCLLCTFHVNPTDLFNDHVDFGYIWPDKNLFSGIIYPGDTLLCILSRGVRSTLYNIVYIYSHRNSV